MPNFAFQLNRKKILLIFLVLVCGTYAYVRMNSDNKGILMLRIPSAYQAQLTQLDPAKITTGYETDLLRNLYGRLVKYEIDGTFSSDVAASYKLVQGSIRFQFTDKVKTFSGHAIDAEDAEASIKRLVLFEGSGHGDIRRLLCPGFKLASMRDNCPGLKTENGELVLTTAEPEFLPHLIAALESMDFSILPKSVIDPMDGSLITKDHRETSGPYYLDTDNAEYSLLKANPQHYLFNRNMPQSVEVRRLSGTTFYDGFNSGAFDLLPTSAYISGETGKKLLADSSLSHHQTYPIRVVVIGFSAQAQRDFSPAQRMHYGLIGGNAFLANYPPLGGQKTEQFFQVLSDATLSKSQLENVNALREVKSVNKPFRKITFGAYGPQYETIKAALAEETDIEVVRLDRAPPSMSENERPDMYYGLNDSAWTENLSLIGYNFKIGMFSLPGIDPEVWLGQYLRTSERSSRIEKLNKLHFDMMMNASFIPMYVAPYFAVGKSDLQFNQNKTSAGIQWWKIRTI